MEQKLSVKALTLTLALIWASAILMVGLINLYTPNYGSAFLSLISSVYPGYHADRTLASVLVGTGYALFDGGTCGFLVAVLYNWLAK